MKARLIHAALFTPLSDGRWGLPLILWGEPGIAKTAAIRQVSGENGFYCEVLSPGERGEGAFGVTPVPVENGHGTVIDYPPPEWVRSLRMEDGTEVGVVFIDELGSVAPALQPALLGAIQERRIGGHQFGPRVRVIGAANPVGHAAGGWDLAAPVANRLGHVDWPAPDANEWGTWLLGGADESGEVRDALKEEARVMKLWPSAFAKASGLAAAFTQRRPELLQKMPKDGDPAQSRAWPSPRSWEAAVRARASAEVHGLTDVEQEELIAAFIGTSAAGEWAVWIDEADLPEPADVLDGKATWKHDPQRLDRTAAVLGACAALVVPAKAERRKERAEAMWKLMAEVMQDAKDVVVPAMTALVRAGLQRSKVATPVLAKMHSVVAAAGMTGGGR